MVAATTRLASIDRATVSVDGVGVDEGDDTPIASLVVPYSQASCG
jgi:hypothetical protein